MKILLPGLAKHLAKYSEGVYAEYEFHDMLTMLAELAPQLIPVSYTHLTLPTNREV